MSTEGDPALFIDEDGHLHLALDGLYVEFASHQYDPSYIRPRLINLPMPPYTEEGPPKRRPRQVEDGRPRR